MTVDEILTEARRTLTLLACEPIWSRDHDRLGFLILDENARRGVRFAPMELDMLKRDSQPSAWHPISGRAATCSAKSFQRGRRERS